MERDMEKARHYWELAAIGGNIRSRHNLGVNEQAKCNYDRALQHFTIATGSGHAGSLKEIQTLYMQGHAHVSLPKWVKFQKTGPRQSIWSVMAEYGREGCVELSSHCAQSLHISPKGNAQTSYGW